MNIAFIAYGTRGDVQPAIALGRALQANGHRVRVLASPNFKNWIEGHGLEAAASRVDVQTVMESEGGQEWIEHGNNPIVQMRVMKKLLDRNGMTMAMDAWGACHDAQAVFSSFTSDAYAVSIAERLNAKHVSTWLQPAFAATRSGAATYNAPLPKRDSALNLLFGRLIVEPAGWRMYGAIANRFRREALGLPPQTERQNIDAAHRALIVHGYSQHVVPHPADWPDSLRAAGYWFLDEDGGWTPPPALIRFLDSGEPPVCIGFGSMTGRDPEKITRLIVEAVKRSGQRAVLLSGWAGLGETELPAGIFRIDSAPHRWLFPRAAAAVHHGGAGTTAASLRAGVPTVIVPHIADQPFWGQRVEALGVGPKAIPRDRLTAPALGEAIRIAAADEGMKRRAAALGEKIRAEDGIGAAVAKIERYLRR